MLTKMTKTELDDFYALKAIGYTEKEADELIALERECQK